MGLTIREFWRPRLEAASRASGEAVKGWSHVADGLPTFLEAPLRLAPEIESANPHESSVILVSAPGAVGKSTLARQVAFETGAMLVNLSEAEPVGGNSIVGGLAKAELYRPFLEGQASLIIDGLDEARMIATQEHFVAFLRDVKDLAEPRRKPLVLLGRTGAVLESWMILDDLGVDPTVLEIGYYDQHQASRFAKLQARHLRNEPHGRVPDGEAIDLLLDRFRRQTSEEPGVFAGYSPVLIAVANSVAEPSSPSDQNTMKLISRIQQGAEPVTLVGITQSILEREQQKLRREDLEDSSLVGKLYNSDEQLGRLAAHLYPGLPLPQLPEMSDSDLEAYNGMLDAWVPDHPFLHGDGNRASSAVFEGLILSHALRDPAITDDSLLAEVLKEKANPFLARFYFKSLDVPSGAQVRVPARHVGLLYASVRAGLSMGETARLRVEGELDETDDLAVAAEVEIAKVRSDGSELKPLRFETDATGTFHLGPHVEGVDMAVPRADVTLGSGSEAVLVAPVSIDADVIYLEAGRVVAEVSPENPIENASDHSTVWLRAEHLEPALAVSRPISREGASLGLSGDWAEHFPWRDFRVAKVEDPDPRIGKAERALFRILRLCRSHPSGVIGGFRAAIDDLRRTRGLGRPVRDQLLRERVLTERAYLYELDPERLASELGLTFQLLSSRTSTAKTIGFLKRALAAAG